MPQYCEGCGDNDNLMGARGGYCKKCNSVLKWKCMWCARVKSRRHGKSHEGRCDQRPKTEDGETPVEMKIKGEPKVAPIAVPTSPKKQRKRATKRKSDKMSESPVSSFGTSSDEDFQDGEVVTLPVPSPHSDRYKPDEWSRDMTMVTSVKKMKHETEGPPTPIGGITPLCRLGLPYPNPKPFEHANIVPSSVADDMLFDHIASLNLPPAHGAPESLMSDEFAQTLDETSCMSYRKAEDLEKLPSMESDYLNTKEISRPLTPLEFAAFTNVTTSVCDVPPKMSLTNFFSGSAVSDDYLRMDNYMNSGKPLKKRSHYDFDGGLSLADPKIIKPTPIQA